MGASKTLIFGAGWIGQQFYKQIADVHITTVNIADEKTVLRELDKIKPVTIINCAGKTGKPNIDSCEKIPEEVYRSNVAGPIILATAAKKRGIYLVQMSSGCLYEGDNGGKGFDENAPPNFSGSVYSRSKAMAEAVLREYDVLQFRLRMPISEIPNPRNLLDKLISYKTIIRQPNSVTVLEDFFPRALQLIEMKKTGVFNMVNEGTEYHDELLKLYQTHVDPDFQFEIIPYKMLEEKMVAGRSNCLLNVEKAKAAGIGFPHIDESFPKLLKNYAKHVNKV